MQSTHHLFLSCSHLPLPPTPWQAFKMALAVPSFNTTLYTRCSPPQPLAKSARLWGVNWHRTGCALLAAPWARGSEEALAPSCCAPHGHDQTYLSPQCRPATAAGGHFCPAATLNTTNGLQGSFSSLDH